MNTSFSIIFHRALPDEVSERLERRILSGVASERQKSSRWQLFLSRVGTGLAGLSLVFGVLNGGSLAARSDFGQLVSLLFSDAGTVLGNGSDFFFSLLETFPVEAALWVAVPLFVLLAFADVLGHVMIRTERYHFSR